MRYLIGLSRFDLMLLRLLEVRVDLLTRGCGCLCRKFLIRWPTEGRLVFHFMHALQEVLEVVQCLVVGCLRLSQFVR